MRTLANVCVISFGTGSGSGAFPNNRAAAAKAAAIPPRRAILASFVPGLVMVLEVESELSIANYIVTGNARKS